MTQSMTGQDVDDIRRALERALDTRITLRRFGIALGLGPASAKRTMMGWVANGPSGPAATALRLFRIAIHGEDIPAEAVEAGARKLAGVILGGTSPAVTCAVNSSDRSNACGIFRAMLFEHVKALIVNQPDTRTADDDGRD